MKDSKWIDISVTVKSGMVHWPSDPAILIKRTHDMEKGDGNNVSMVSMGLHTGTHMDAPLHFIAKGKSLEKIPFGATIGPAKVILIKNKKYITIDELKHNKINLFDRIIFKTQNSSYWKSSVFHKHFVYITSEAAEYLASLKVRTVGIDYLSIGGYHLDGAKTHKALLKNGVWIIEGLNLTGVKPGEYDLICLPIKIFNSDGAPARAIIRKRARNAKKTI